MFDQLMVKDRQAELLTDAEQRRMARQGSHKEPLVKLRLTIEFQLGRGHRRAASHLQSEGG